jgi:hypothetical protein
MYARPLCVVAIAVLIFAGGAGCATYATRTSIGNNAVAASLPGKPACFWLRNVFDWTVLNDSELIVHAPLEQNAYLVKLFEPVFDLGFYLRLGFEDVEHTGQICNGSDDYLIVRGYTPPRIPIVAVHELTKAQQTALLRSAGKHLASAQRSSHPGA